MSRDKKRSQAQSIRGRGVRVPAHAEIQSQLARRSPIVLKICAVFLSVSRPWVRRPLAERVDPSQQEGRGRVARKPPIERNVRIAWALKAVRPGLPELETKFDLMRSECQAELLGELVGYTHLIQRNAREG